MEVKKQLRTLKQSNSIHLYFEQVATELSNQGQTVQSICERIQRVEIHPTKESVKEVIFKPIIKALYNKRSSTELTTKELSKAYEVMSQFLSREFEISIPLPSVEKETI